VGGAMGTYLLGRKHSRAASGRILSEAAYSTKLINCIPASFFEELTQTYETDELFTFYERGVNGISMVIE